MLSVVLTLLGAALIGATIGFEMRRAGALSQAARSAVLFPRLSVLAALIIGVAAGEVGVLSATRLWPSLAALMTGPLLTLYGFTWYYESLTIYRQLISASAPGGALEPSGLSPARPPASPLVQAGWGAQMGVVLCAAGAWDLVSLVVALTVAFGTATAVFGARINSRSQHSPEIIRCAAGALLCALGAGALTERMSDHNVSGDVIAVILAAPLWTVAAVTYRRAMTHSRE